MRLAGRTAKAPPQRRCRACKVITSAMTGPAFQKASCKVAVIGAGAAGLVSIRELLREGHQVIGFEQGPKPGGVWVYDTATDSDLLGAQPSRRRVHGSMYRDLRTNLPRELMGFSDVPFTPAMMGPASSDPRRFCSHREVLTYLDMFADLHQLHQHVQFNTQVLQATPITGSSSSSSGGGGGGGNTANGSSTSIPSSSSSSTAVRWQVLSVRLGPDGSPEQEPVQQDFDALVVCNGHYSQPNLPDVPDAGVWPGVQLHSHNYRVPEAFSNQVVVVVGASNSGEDVCREVSAVAEQVVVAARSWKNPEWGRDPRPFGPRGNISRRGMVSQLHANGCVEFAEGPPLDRADTIIYCTGYRYKFSFLEHNPATGALSGQQYVPGLYRHMFVPQFGASLTFVGLPWKVVPFPQFELQAKLAARLLSGRCSLPALQAMQSDVSAFYQQLEASGQPLRYAHMMNEQQWAYNDWLAEIAGVDKLAGWRPAMYASNAANKRAHPEDYRDTWEDAASVQEADQELVELVQVWKSQQAAAGTAAAGAAASGSVATAL